MDKQVKQLIVDALRSGEYKKIKGCLRKDRDCFCIEGVICDVFAKQKDVEWTVSSAGNHSILGCSSVMPIQVEMWCGLEYGEVLKLRYMDVEADVISLNDDTDITFDEIADLIEEQW